MEHHKETLIKTVKQLTQCGKGILAADESDSTLKKKFDTISLETTVENARAYRELLFTTVDIENYISGVILFAQTVDQKAADGTPLVELLNKKGIVPGIKLDKGMAPLVDDSKETFTKGMDDLAERAKAFFEKGCRFAKWRCTLRADAHHPSELSIRETAYTLARYASVCQSNGLVPIVEPELLTDGAWDLKHGAQVSKRIFAAVFKALADYGVLLEGCLFKPHMVTAAAEGPKACPKEVAKATVDILRATIPASLGGIFFLSGGQSEKEATRHLHEVNAYAKEVGRPWTLSFSFGRALQNSVIATWKGLPEHKDAAQKVLTLRAKFNSDAVKAEYDEAADAASDQSNYEKDYKY